MANNENLTRAYESAKEEGIKTLLQASLVYSLRIRNFDDENYYVEDVTSVVARARVCCEKIPFWSAYWRKLVNRLPFGIHNFFL